MRCGSPAMRDKRYCFFHQPERQRDARRMAERERQRWLEKVDLNDAKAAQRALWEVMWRVIEGRIEGKKAAEIIERLRDSRPVAKDAIRMGQPGCERKAGSSPALERVFGMTSHRGGKE